MMRWQPRRVSTLIPILVYIIGCGSRRGTSRDADLAEALAWFTSWIESGGELSAERRAEIDAALAHSTPRGAASYTQSASRSACVEPLITSWPDAVVTSRWARSTCASAAARTPISTPPPPPVPDCFRCGWPCWASWRAARRRGSSSSGAARASCRAAGASRCPGRPRRAGASATAGARRCALRWHRAPYRRTR